MLDREIRLKVIEQRRSRRTPERTAVVLAGVPGPGEVVPVDQVVVDVPDPAMFDALPVGKEITLRITDDEPLPEPEPEHHEPDLPEVVDEHRPRRKRL